MKVIIQNFSKLTDVEAVGRVYDLMSRGRTTSKKLVYPTIAYKDGVTVQARTSANGTDIFELFNHK